MLKRLKIEGFKSLRKVDVPFSQMTVLFGPNAGGKSNLLEALSVLSRMASNGAYDDASGHIRGNAIELFSFPPGGLPELLRMDSANFELQALLEIGKKRESYHLRGVIHPKSGDTRYPRLSRPSRKCLEDISGWRIYFPDPRSMRLAGPPADVRGIGIHGEDIASFLYRLRAKEPKCFSSLQRTMNVLVPGVEDVTVDLDERRGTIDIGIRQDGVTFSSRVVSEGTLRVLALCACAVNPWNGSLLGFEEPENGVHPRRIELIAKLLVNLAVMQGRQVVVTTHSPLFCDAVLRESRSHQNKTSLLNVRRGPEGTEIEPIKDLGALPRVVIDKGLAEEHEEGIFQDLVLRGMLGE
jgi:energy-coupling factor transporter ATP-binding protein EcfA2